MKTYIIFIIVTSFILFVFIDVVAQSGRFNLNINNGLPSNNAYYALRDKEGYLWVSTDRGIVKYNGYDFKLFDLSSGINNDDVWYMFEDKKQKLWLSSVSNEMGYIKNDQYHKAFIKSASLPLYPIYISENETGINFLSISHGNCFCHEKNDTITCIPINIPDNAVYLRKDGALVIIHDGTTRIVTNKGTNLEFKRGCYSPPKKDYYYYYLFNNYLIPFPYKAIDDRLLKITDVTNCTTVSITLERDENIYMLNTYNGSCYLTGNKGIYRLNDKTGIKKILSVNGGQEKKFKVNDILTVIQDSLWGQCITTATNGVYINYPESKFNLLRKDQRVGYRYVGCSGDSSQYWWSKSERTLARYDKTGAAHFHQYPEILDITKIGPGYGKKSIVLANSNIFIIEGDKLSDFYSGFRNVTVTDKTDTGVFRKGTIKYTFQTFPRVFNDFAAGVNGEFCFLRTGGGCALFKLSADSLSILFVDEKMYRHVSYDPLRRKYWIYSNDIISLLGEKSTFGFDKSMLSKFGVKKIESISIDKKYGNIFLKCNDQLYAFDTKNVRLRECLRNYNLKGAILVTDKGQLIVGGRFGLLFIKLNGLGNLGAPVLYPNIKNNIFTYLTDIAPTNTDSVILNTDVGQFIAPIASNQWQNGSENLYNSPRKVIIHYHSTNYIAGINDTILVTPDDPVLQPDIINPIGNGSVRYKYMVKGIDFAWHSLNDEKLYLQGLHPGGLYMLSIAAHDETWRGNPVNFTIQIMPRWWQTDSGRKIIWIVSVAFIVLLIAVIILVTRSIVSRKHVKNTMQLELHSLHLALELKSIYAQINPHFIFNTLTTALYFIKKRKFDDAYEHVSAFSELLRSYIKSSRNKFITLSEEIENLEHYILLQQARFENKFDFNIAFDDSIEPKSTQIPSLLIQPLVENAINHGLLHKEDGLGHLNITFKNYAHEQTLTCIIDDDGIGREKAKQYREQSIAKTPSYGTDLVKELVNILNRMPHIEIFLEYKDKMTPETGTTVTITIKNTE